MTPKQRRRPADDFPDAQTAMRKYVSSFSARRSKALSNWRKRAKSLVDPYINATLKQFEQMGATPKRAPCDC